MCGLPMPWLMSVMYVSVERVFYARVSKKFLFHCFSIFGLLKKKLWRLKDDEVEVNRWKEAKEDENESRRKEKKKIAK